MWKKTALLICDLQKRVLPHIKNNDRVIKNTQTLLDANTEYKRIQNNIGDTVTPSKKILGKDLVFVAPIPIPIPIPIIVAELIPEKLGKTPPSIMDRVKQGEKSLFYIEKGFYSVYSKNLAQTLRAKDVNEIVITGVQTEWCITKTALDFKKAGFNVLIPDDAVGSTDDSEHIKALKRLALKDIKIVTTHSFIVDNLTHVDDPMSKWYLNYKREKENEKEMADSPEIQRIDKVKKDKDELNMKKLYRDLDDIYGDIRSISYKKDD